MTSFSDIPFFLLKKYFDEIEALNDETSSSFSLLGPGSTIVTKGGNIIEVYVIDNGSYKKVWLSPVTSNFITDDRYLLFKKHNRGEYTEDGTSTTYSLNSAEFTVYDPVSSELVTIDPGSDVYIRKDSLFHDWITSEAESYYQSNWYSDFLIRNFVNTDKTFIYFGEIYTDSSPNYRIKYNSLKYFSLDAIPEHQREDDLKEFFDIYFDKIHSEPYNRLKDLKTLNDPLEIDIKYIDYIADMYNFSLTDNFSNTIKRYFMRSIVDILKRKGTYASIYALWKILTNSSNRINIYERWYDKNLSGTLTESDFDDYLYLDRYIDLYDVPYLKDGVGLTFYKDFLWGTNYLESFVYVDIFEEENTTWNIEHSLNSQSISAEFYDFDSVQKYPSITVIDDNNILAEFSTATYGYVYVGLTSKMADDTIQSIEISGSKLNEKKLSPYYSVEIDFTDEPLGTEKIIDSSWHQDIIDYWEEMRIVDRRSFYKLLCAPITNYTRDYVHLFSNGSDIYLKTRFEGDESYKTTTSEEYHLATFTSKLSTWEVEHNFNTRNILCDIYSENKRIVPLKIDQDTPNKLIITWNSPKSGIVMIKKSDFDIDITSSESSFDHTLNTEYVITEFYDTSNEQIILEKVDIIDNDTIEFTSLVDAKALMLDYDYFEDITIASNEWLINHNLNNKYVFARFYDSNNEQIMPYEIELFSANTIKATFNSSITGRVVINTVGTISLFDRLNANSTFEFYDEQEGSTPVYSDTIDDLYEDSTYIYIECQSEYSNAYTIKEIRIVNPEGETIFRTQCSDIDKLEDVQAKFVFKINKGEL